MARGWSAAITLCAVMFLMSAAPLVAANTHYMVKCPQGPRASSETWIYEPTTYGTWTGHIVNHGLKSLVVNVYDVTGGTLSQVFHQRIRFAVYGLFPTGSFDTEEVVMARGHTYSITAIPNGPRGASCDFDDVFEPASCPCAVFSATSSYLVVTVDGGASYDNLNGTIVEWEWEFGDGGVATGVTAVHAYQMEGLYSITLTVTDNDGLTGTATQPVLVVGAPPTADLESVFGFDECS